MRKILLDKVRKDKRHCLWFACHCMTINVLPSLSIKMFKDGFFSIEVAFLFFILAYDYDPNPLPF